MNKLEKLEQDVKDAQAVYAASEVVYDDAWDAVAVAYEEACDDAFYGDNYGSAFAASLTAGYAAAVAEVAFKLAKKKLNYYLEGQANE